MSAALFPSSAVGEWFERLKDQIDLHDLADRLGLKRKGSKGNYRSPHHPDSTPSLSILPNGRGWKDWSTEEGGSCIDLVLYCQPELGTPMEAARLLGEWYGIPQPRRVAEAQSEQKSIVEFIATKCLAAPEPVVDYLVGRGIDEAVVRRALKNRAIGWNAWKSEKVPAGEQGHGGPAAAFLVRAHDTARVVAVDLRYADPALNGGAKTQCQGEKEAHAWTSDATRLRRAHTVYIVESPINALSVESCALPNGTAALAIRGTGNADKLDLAFLKGKRVVIALDHCDAVNERTGQRPGLAAAWRLSERLTACDIAALLVDMQDWEEGEDINDVLKTHGASELLQRLRRLEPWLIPGMPGGGERLQGTRRVFLPDYDFKVYWRYRAREDFTQYVDEFREGEDGERQETLADLCSFRIAALSRLRVQGHLATINGTPDTQSETVFGISAQAPRHGATLQREVVDDRMLFNLEWWRSRFGAIFKPHPFMRMINILERSADLGARDVVNFVGLAWRDSEPAALEGSDCYFMEPAKQCLYHNMAFPRGTTQAARVCIEAFQATFKRNAAAIPFVWALGAHLKAVLGFYPHFQMQAEKGSGKSKLLESMQSALAFQVLSGQMLKTDHRRRASVSYTSHPVGWDEFSKLPKTVLSEIDGLLQSTYRFEFTRVGASLTPYLMCAPVLLAGEEVDVASLQSKICRSSLTSAKQGPLIPNDLPQFPVWQWLQFLARVGAGRILEQHSARLAFCRRNSRAPDADTTARRMMENYAAILTAWDLLCEFAGLDAALAGFAHDLMAEMNEHIADTDGVRLPWVWITEILLSEIEANRFDHPYCWDTVRTEDGKPEPTLFLRPSHVMDHLSTAPHLRTKFDALPIKTARVFKQQLLASGVVLIDEAERTIRGRRMAHLTGLSVAKLERLGLYATPLMTCD
ncbi:toprim domain-containing protein [Niveibacterium microcysteis]|uniref:Toprim domain-containing protein n=1 Tax=Niveibacterium microcysteis TaxID=2811415 RepID=A0ABX7MAA7_9RHOO|nr:toprim domain-containing protein [Niveibacterium microcysteis]QSI78680.1 toprim domain-containing protein [Niveibacterium microcysteis]